VELQIRTKRMDEIAEKGYAAHWKYKDNTAKYESNLEKWLVRVRETLEKQDLSALEFVDDFRGNLFNEEVFVFTPKGELKTIAKGATALDFAFEIHTDIGAKCIGAKVNQKLVPINHVLKNGDQIEILTSSKQKPNEDWLRFVMSSKAKSKIKDLLKEDRRKVAEEGKEILNRKLRSMKIEPSQKVNEQLRDFFKVSSQLELLFKIGKGIIGVNDLKRFQDYKPTAPKKIQTDEQEVKAIEQEIKSKRHEDTLLIGEDMDVVEYKLAKCCTPIPGDEVFGFVTVSEGIKIHRANCPNAPELLANHGNRVIKAKWTSQHEVSFLTGLRVVGTDRVGLINDVSKVISEELKVNMSSISFKTEPGIFSGEIMLYVNDTRHLETLISKLEKVEGVEQVSRFDGRGS
ncbi:MAG TPA: RelA/SpoT family protein, partial [Cytophagales bacterium]|nr:RelA/SpoT family protein [Cytophagales bacterium]